MPSLNSNPTRFISIDPAGEHIECRPADPADIVECMSGIWELKVVSDTARKAPAMEKLAAHLRRLSPASNKPDGDINFANVCCDIREEWSEIRRARAHVLSGRSARKGTLILLFAPTDVDACVIEVSCEF